MAALHLAGAAFDAAPEITAADHKAHLNTHIHAGLDGGCHIRDLCEIQTKAIALGRLLTQRLTTDLQQDALILQFIQTESPFPIYPILF